MAKANEIYSNGNNTKLGNNVSILNLPPIKTCVNCSTCAGSCYARFRYQYPNVQKRWNRNLEMTQRGDFVELSTIELKYKATPIVRFHESGDFYNDEYIDKCFDLAVANPNISFYGYTKNKNALRLNVLSNVNIIYSFVDTNIGEVRNYGTKEYCEYLRDNYNATICPHGYTADKENFKCMIDCQECLTCDNVCFVEHGNRASKDTYSRDTLWEMMVESGD